MPKPELARAWPPASYLIVARSSDADVSAGRIRYRQVVDTERWLEHWTGLWPTDQSSAGWSRADLRLIVRPLALVYLWTELDVAIAKAWAEGPRLSPAQYGAASSRLEACCAQEDVHSFPAELCSAANIASESVPESRFGWARLLDKFESDEDVLRAMCRMDETAWKNYPRV